MRNQSVACASLAPGSRLIDRGPLGIHPAGLGTDDRVRGPKAYTPSARPIYFSATASSPASSAAVRGARLIPRRARLVPLAHKTYKKPASAPLSTAMFWAWMLRLTPAPSLTSPTQLVVPEAPGGGDA